jgi:L-fucose isomerase
MTMARLARKNGRYWLAIVPCDFVEFPRDVMRAKASTTTQEWPHCFARVRVSPEEFLSTYPCNHIHGICGDWVKDLQHVAGILGIESRVYE